MPIALILIALILIALILIALILIALSFGFLRAAPLAQAGRYRILFRNLAPEKFHATPSMMP